jgi:hypothetical protein
MRPLTLDDLLPLEDYAARRREFFESQKRYLDHYRRVRIGPRVSILFENRQTLWYRVQEILRIARLAEPQRVQEELDVYNILLPGPSCLHAALILQPEASPGAHIAWQDLTGEHLRFCIGPEALPSTIITARPEDRATGFSHWIQFRLGTSEQNLLEDSSLAAYFEMNLPSYRYENLWPKLEDRSWSSFIGAPGIAALRVK